MKILSIETSCDETAVAVLEASGTEKDAVFVVLGNALYSQAKKHAAYGGVYPTLAKREHAANLCPLLDNALTESSLKEPADQPLSDGQVAFLNKILPREPDMRDALLKYLSTVTRPNIDAIAVTQGPGLEPALWVGINFARALAYVWDLPIIPVNHLEGHIVASAVHSEDEKQKRYAIRDIPFPILGLVLSGGHTEFIHAPKWGEYEVVGSTRDDSIGEAFDKVARLLGVPYPGGPELSRLAAKGRHALNLNSVQIEKDPTKPLPRPMLHSGDLDFSFSGLKTAVLYQVKEIENLTDGVRARFAADFEDAVSDVVLRKTADALDQYPVNAFVLGGGVSANTCIRGRLGKMFEEREQNVELYLPALGLSTDNAVMIGMAGYLDHIRGEQTMSATEDLSANGTLSM